MTKVTVYQSGNLYVGFHISGHADFAEHGEDIVCSAISILGYTAAQSTSTVAKVSDECIEYSEDPDSGEMLLFIKEIDSQEKAMKVNVIIESFIVGMTMIGDLYRNHLKLQYEEVQSNEVNAKSSVIRK